jgi:hypothetical protein
VWLLPQRQPPRRGLEGEGAMKFIDELTRDDFRELEEVRCIGTAHGCNNTESPVDAFLLNGCATYYCMCGDMIGVALAHG